MARLSSNGFEVARFEKVKVDGTAAPGETFKVRITHSIRSNGHILRKVDDWRNPRSWEGSKPQHHSSGWKRWRKIKKGIDVLDFVRRKQETLIPKGWTRVDDDSAPPYARIVV